MSAPNIVFNPETGRYVKAAGRKGRNLARRGVVAPRASVKVRAPKFFGLPDIFGPGPRVGPRVTAKAPRFGPQVMGCPPGTVQSPRTRRCVKIGTRVFNQLVKEFGPPPGIAIRGPAAVPYRPSAAPYQPIPPPAVYRPAEALYRPAEALYQPFPPAPYRPAARPDPEPLLTELSPHLGAHDAGVAPLVDRASVLGWASTNCRNPTDPLTGIPFNRAEPAALQELVRLHNGTCTFATPLDSHVADQHKRGTIATLPDDSRGHRTLEDFKALRDAMRRHTPGYKIPGRKHQRPPSTWQLYVASDERSGPHYVTVAYVDVMKGVMRADGPHYPDSAIVIDMGFLPADFAGTVCTGPMLMGMLQRLDAAGKLLSPVAGGWKASAGFPFSKRHWEHDKKRKMDRLCTELSGQLGTL